MKVKVFQKGDFRKTEKFMKGALVFNIRGVMERYGKAGVEALAAATPKDTGLTAASWGYEIEIKHGDAKVTWTNSNVKDGYPIAILIQFGHGTGTGGYVEGVDYINPAMRDIFQQLADAAWKEVKGL